MPSEEEIKRAYDTVDRDLSDDVTWSEWQVALAYNNQLTEKNLLNVYQFLNLKQKKQQRNQQKQLSNLEYSFSSLLHCKSNSI